MHFILKGGESKTGELPAGTMKSGGNTGGTSSGRKLKSVVDFKDSDTGDHSEKGML